MDVSATNGAARGQPAWAAPPSPHGTDAAREGTGGPARRAAEEAATSAVRERRTEAPPPATARPQDRDHLSVTEIPVPAKEPGKEEERDGSSLKFDVAAADVLARFAIHEETNRVVVTMFQRDTGEVIREIPPREVLDVMAALSGRGLMVDIST